MDIPNGNALGNHCGLWNHPAGGGMNSDALVGHGPCHMLPMRPAGRADPPSPTFSSCTLPVVLEVDWPFNFHEVFSQAICVADVLLRQKGLTDRDATLVLSMPQSMSPLAYHHVMLSPYSRRPLVSLDDIGAPGLEGAPAHWSAEGSHVRCFQRLLACKFFGHAQAMTTTAAEVLRVIEPHLPPDPLGWGVLPGWEGSTLRVAIEVRHGGSRSLRNLHQLVEACEEQQAKGFTEGAWTGLSCRPLSTADTPTLHGPARFTATVAAVRSAHILVAVHGAGATNSYWLRQTDNGGTAVVEVRPCGFGSRFAGWPDAYMANMHQRSGEVIRFFAYNVEDPAQCAPSDYEAAARADPTGATPLRGGDDFRARDQHLQLRPGPFLAYLRRVARLLRSPAAYDEAKRAGRLHAYGLAEGFALGPLGVANVSAALAEGRLEVVRAA